MFVVFTWHSNHIFFAPCYVMLCYVMLCYVMLYHLWPVWVCRIFLIISQIARFLKKELHKMCFDSL